MHTVFLMSCLGANEVHLRAVTLLGLEIKFFTEIVQGLKLMSAKNLKGLQNYYFFLLLVKQMEGATGLLLTV